MAAAEALTADELAEGAVGSEPPLGLTAAGSDAGFGEADGAGIAVDGEAPFGEAEQQDFPWAGAVEQQGGLGADTPAIPDPRPSF